MHGDVFKDGSRNSTKFNMELSATIGNGRAYKQLTVVFACCCSNSTIFACKIKIGWKWSCLEDGIRFIFLFVGMFLHIFENSNSFLSYYHPFSFRKLIAKMKTGIIIDFVFRGFINRSNQQDMFWKIMCIKDWNKITLTQLNFNTG